MHLMTIYQIYNMHAQFYGMLGRTDVLGLNKCTSMCVPVAQWLEQRLWVRFPGNTRTDKKICIA